MRRPRKAVVLAAGLGTRMLPLSATLPKPLLPLWGTPMITHMIRLLRDWGVREVLVNLHHQPGPILAHLLREPEPGIRVCLSYEPAVLGTGGVLRRASWFLDGNPFWMVNSDVAADLDPAPMLRAYRPGRTAAVLCLHPRLGPRTVEMQNGIITDFHSRHPGADGTCTFTGIQLVAPDIFDAMPRCEPAFSIIDVYRRMMRRGRRIAGVACGDGFWADVGTPESYSRVHDDVRARARRGKRGARLYRRGALRGIPARHPLVSSGPVLEAALSRLGWPVAKTSMMPLAARGSDRDFTRLACGRRTAILVRYGTARPENTRHAAHARFLLGHGIPVPRVLADMPARRATVMEDLGDATLESYAGQLDPKKRERMVRLVLDGLLRLHHIPGRDLQRHAKRTGLERPFTPALYRWEHELMAEHFLRGRMGLGASQIESIMAELQGVARRLNRFPRVLLHRDMQSSNILLARNRPWFIDFQGMRLGPAAYDLASLLCDPYVMYCPAEQRRLLAYYVERSPDGAAVASAFWGAAVQRLAQALGAFGRLSALPGMRRFDAYIPPAVQMMRRALGHIEGLPRLREALGAVCRKR